MGSKKSTQPAEKLGFKKYLEIGVEKGTFGDTPENDFAVDALRDKGFRDFAQWDPLRNYITLNGACVEAVAAAKAVFARWTRSELLEPPVGDDGPAGLFALGVDPGVNGAFVLTDGKRLTTWPMPTETDGKNKTVSYKGLVKLVAAIVQLRRKPHVFLERAIPMAQGAKSAFSYGRGFEALSIALEVAGFSTTLVDPHKWTKEMHEGISADLRPKAKSLIAVKRLYPQLVGLLPKRPKGGLEDGPVDALLLAGYGLRRLGVPAVKAPPTDDVGDFM